MLHPNMNVRWDQLFGNETYKSDMRWGLFIMRNEIRISRHMMVKAYLWVDEDVRRVHIAFPHNADNENYLWYMKKYF